MDAGSFCVYPFHIPLCLDHSFAGETYTVEVLLRVRRWLGHSLASSWLYQQQAGVPSFSDFKSYIEPLCDQGASSQNHGLVICLGSTKIWCLTCPPLEHPSHQTGTFSDDILDKVDEVAKMIPHDNMHNQQRWGIWWTCNAPPHVSP